MSRRGEPRLAPAAVGPMSLRGFGRHLGVSDTAVRKAIREGRVTAVGQDAKGRPVITDAALAKAQWDAHTRPRVDVRSARTYREPEAAAGAPIVAAWNHYIDAMGRVDRVLDDVFAAHCRALGYDPDADEPVPTAGLEVWRRLGAAERAAARAHNALVAAVAAAGLGLAVEPPDRPASAPSTRA